MKLSTINQIVEGIIAEGEAKYEKEKDDWSSKELFMEEWEIVANEATIYLKMALICEHSGIDKAMEYYFGPHSEDEYKEFLTSVVAPEDVDGKDL